MEILRRDGQYDRLRDLGETVQGMAREALDPTGIPYRIVGDPTLFDVVFADAQPRDYRAVQAADAGRARRWNEALRTRGIFKSPSKTYPCLALTDADLDRTRTAITGGSRCAVVIPA